MKQHIKDRKATPGPVFDRGGLTVELDDIRLDMRVRCRKRFDGIGVVEGLPSPKAREPCVWVRFEGCSYGCWPRQLELVKEGVSC